MSILAELTTFSGLPAHPLVVHLPVVIVPLALVGAIAALARPSWRPALLPVVAGLSGLGLLGVQLAIMSGEGLEDIVGEESAAIERHAEMGEQARPVVFAFFALALAAAVVVTLLRRGARRTTAEGADTPGSGPTALRRALVALCALSVLAGGLSTVAVTRAGHSGAESVWEDETDGGPGREIDDEDGDREQNDIGDHEDDDD